MLNEHEWNRLNEFFEQIEVLMSMKRYSPSSTKIIQIY